MHQNPAYWYADHLKRSELNSAVQCSGVVMEQPLPALIFKLLSLDDLQWQDVIFIG